MNLYIYYRISDKGNPKQKLPNADKFSCLNNAVKEFGAENFHIITDNCSAPTIERIKDIAAKTGVSFEETSLGNAASFLYMANKIIQKHMPTDYVYLLEDDYLHRAGSKKALLEGLAIADYVTLYDHPDKYWLRTNKGNPFNFNSLQKTTVYFTESAYWREVNSTTMTFACSVQTLKNDYKIWEKNTLNTKIPNDFFAFCEITQNRFPQGGLRPFLYFFLRQRAVFKVVLKNILSGKKVKRLVSSIPAYSTHTEPDFLSPVIDWTKI